ncbi:MULTISPECIES: hypothetical protein [Streptomyces]|uniref:Uncharacterized protein n=1 Tax=Streptomyces venezuelae TaxID=54571 RepID=A0A5P2AT55_STRVZ|nr:hypothetical protein [Streptomyces venezuelae]QES21295.1 hypothetical protein DEJ46_21100 [Streptomyces venezuelae]
MTAHQPAELSAQMVKDALDRAGTRGLTFDELVEDTGLTYYQVRYGISFLRESLADLKDSDAVFTYDPREHVYRIVYIPEVAELYEVFRLQGEATRTLRMLAGTVIPHSKLARTKAVRLMRRHLEVVVEDAKDLLAPV